MPRVGFEPTIPVFERAKTVHALERAATGSGSFSQLPSVKIVGVIFLLYPINCYNFTRIRCCDHLYGVQPAGLCAKLYLIVVVQMYIIKV
jgi:hypothetical protein